MLLVPAEQLCAEDYSHAAASRRLPGIEGKKPHASGTLDTDAGLRCLNAGKEVGGG